MYFVSYVFHIIFEIYISFRFIILCRYYLLFSASEERQNCADLFEPSFDIVTDKDVSTVISMYDVDTSTFITSTVITNEPFASLLHTV